MSSPRFIQTAKARTSPTKGDILELRVGKKLTFGVDQDDESNKSQTDDYTKFKHPMPELSSEVFSSGFNEGETSAATANYMTHRVYAKGPVLNDGHLKSQEVMIRQSLQHV